MSDYERAVILSEKIENEFCRRFGGFRDPKPVAVLLEGLGDLLSQQELHELLSETLEKLSLDKQAKFLGVE